MARMPPPVVKIPGTRKKDSYLYHALNRNKRNMSINLKKEEVIILQERIRG